MAVLLKPDLDLNQISFSQWYLEQHAHINTDKYVSFSNTVLFWSEHGPRSQISGCSHVLLSQQYVNTFSFSKRGLLQCTQIRFCQSEINLFPLTPCCQAGLHLPETERQLHGDPQQRRWDWKVGGGSTTGDKTGVILRTELWSDISCLKRSGSDCVSCSAYFRKSYIHTRVGQRVVLKNCFFWSARMKDSIWVFWGKSSNIVVWKKCSCSHPLSSSLPAVACQ